MKIQWDVVWSVLRTLLVAGGPAGTLLLAFGLPPLQVSTWLGIGLAVVGVLSVAIPGFIGALNRTDGGKAAAIASLSPEKQAAVAAALPDETKIAAAANVPGVTQIVVSKDASDGAATAAQDPMLPNVQKAA